MPQKKDLYMLLLLAGTILLFVGTEAARRWLAKLPDTHPESDNGTLPDHVDARNPGPFPAALAHLEKNEGGVDARGKGNESQADGFFDATGDGE
jgi:hypothetical protein